VEKYDKRIGCQALLVGEEVNRKGRKERKEKKEARSLAFSPSYFAFCGNA
jgi:hypothetical protein